MHNKKHTFQLVDKCIFNFYTANYDNQNVKT